MFLKSHELRRKTTGFSTGYPRRLLAPTSRSTSVSLNGQKMAGQIRQLLFTEQHCALVKLAVNNRHLCRDLFEFFDFYRVRVLFGIMGVVNGNLEIRPFIVKLFAFNPELSSFFIEVADYTCAALFAPVPG